NPLPTGGISFDGGTGTNKLFLQGALPSGPFTNEVETPSGANAGTINLDGLTITYQNVALIGDTVPVTNFSKEGTSAAAQINVLDGPTTNGFSTTQINGGMSSTFATINVANKKNLTIDGLGGGDTINVAATPSATSTFINGGSGVDTVRIGSATRG